MKKKIILTITLLIVLTVFINIEFKQNMVLIVFNIIIIILFIYRNRLSIITLLLLCANVIVVPILIQNYMGSSYGLLQLGLFPLYTTQILKIYFIYNTTMLIGSIVFSFSNREKVILKELKYHSTSTPLNIFFNNIVAIIFTIVAFPRLSLGLAVSDSERFAMLLPGHAWNALAVIALLFNLPQLHKNSVKLTYLFCSMWFFLNGERADMIGLFLGILVYSLLTNEDSILKKAKFIVLGLTLGWMAFVIGDIRIGNSSSTDGKPLWFNLVTFSTASDVGYLLNATVDFVNHGIYTNGLTMLSDYSKAIPFSNNSNDFSHIISQYYPNPGGEPLIAASILDFGNIGPSISVVVDLIILKIVVSCKSRLFVYEYMLLLCSIPRIAWYGRNFVFTGFLVFVPLMFICNALIYNLSEKKVNNIADYNIRKGK